MDADLAQRLHKVLDRVEAWLPPEPAAVDWSRDVAAIWQRNALGGQLIPVAARDSVGMDDLVGIERQKTALLNNTRAFLHGRPANHALLWGARGSGKSSMVRALLNTLAPEGLRLIQVDRHDLVGLPGLVQRLRGSTHRFIVYCDDLSFEGHDDAYKALKSVLDGTLTGPPENVLLYATSNRRHLLPESLGDNQDTRLVDGELHHGDAVEERISLSDRFGLWLAFHPFNQDTYLDACRHWVHYLGGDDAWSDAAREDAVRFATLRGVRSGRAAWQFACQWVGAMQEAQ
ncbi:MULTISPECIES: ATP-binding protein [Chromohalobacter]|uniref:ATP-binding protein n=2 Tax=Chromohalobacter TaxID=42054 RepID=A0A9X2X1B8_9GAMM|nr:MULTISPECIES: ATP-binding protein [Chromohalobacter]MCK0767312.1 ATP-binding protein [Chromohalobacter canadensis]MCT8468387.1 ATP-binding protein [Chromohalobacter canadensis]MCT8471442.1 ATP-binding protein [Chromohalobacter canadensis]MCT8498895.1 ATP-binding protein [Chromohalobacter canadensis]MCT8504788.1 ATP-binding protein [Chromohalobacter moromii]